LDKQKIAKYQVRKLWLSVMETIRDLGSKVQLEDCETKEYEPNGLLMFFFSEKQGTAVIGRGGIDTLSIMRFLAKHNPNVVKIGYVDMDDKRVGVV